MNKLSLLLGIIILSLAFVSAVPPFQTSTTTDGCFVEYPKIDTFKIGTQTAFNFHISNVTSGKAFTNTTHSCEFHLYNKLGEHIARMQAAYDGLDFEVTAPASNFSQYGEMSYIFYCNNSYSGCLASAPMEITPNGFTITTAQSNIQIIFFVASVFVFLLCLLGAIKIPWSNPRGEDDKIIGINELKYVKLFLIVMSYIVFLLIMAMLRGILFNYIYDIYVYKFFNWAYWILMSGMYPIIVVSLILALIHLLTDKKIRNDIERGLSFEG